MCRARSARGDPELQCPRSAVGDSKANGRNGNALQRVQNQFRRILHNVQTKSGVILGVDDPLFGWMMEWAGGLITRYVKGEDGKSAYARVRAHETSRTISEFGEHVLYVPLAGSHNVRGKMSMKKRKACS